MPPPMDVRPALTSDVDDVVALGQSTRRKMAAWEPDLWTPTANADREHRSRLTRLIEAGPTPFYVGLSRGNLIAAGSLTPARGFSALSEFHLSTPAVAAAVLPMIGHRPLRVMVPRKDSGLRAAMDVSDFTEVSSCFAIATSGSGAESATEVKAPPAAPFVTAASELNRHDTFVVSQGSSFLVGRVVTDDASIYDPCSAVVVADRVGTPDLLEQAIGAAAARGATILMVICPKRNLALAAALESLGFSHPADIFEG